MKVFIKCGPEKFETEVTRIVTWKKEGKVRGTPIFVVGVSEAQEEDLPQDVWQLRMENGDINLCTHDEEVYRKAKITFSA